MPSQLNSRELRKLAGFTETKLRSLRKEMEKATEAGRIDVVEMCDRRIASLESLQAKLDEMIDGTAVGFISFVPLSDADFEMVNDAHWVVFGNDMRSRECTPEEAAILYFVIRAIATHDADGQAVLVADWLGAKLDEFGMTCVLSAEGESVATD